MSMIAKVKAENKTASFGNHRNWETKLGPVTPKVSPDEMIASILNGGSDMAVEFLKSAGDISFFPGCLMTTIEHISRFYKVEPACIRQLHGSRLKKFREDGYSVSRILPTSEILEDLARRGVRVNVCHDKYYKVLSICGDGIECSHFTLPSVGKSSLYTPEAVLAMAVCLFTSSSDKKSQVADNLVARLISSEYVDDALRYRDEKVRQLVDNIHQKASCECSEPVCHEVSEPVVEAPAASEKVEDDDVAKVLERVLKAMEASDKRPESKEVDYLKTLATMFSSMTAMAVTSFFKSIMVGSMKEVMKEIMAEMVTTK